MTDLTRDDLMFAHDLRAHVRDEQEMFGIDGVVNALIIALVMRGHVLLEGNPGLGKTALVRALAQALGLAEPVGSCARKAVGRIQFTPDLMPSDITGTKLPDNDNRLVFEPGPVFANLLLADEINRATPKTQSAMLEAMAEFQVTVLGQTHPLVQRQSLRHDDHGSLLSYEIETPFLVLATQNPVEQEGTNPLPEAQLDRFLMKVRMPFPSRDTLSRIIDKDVRRAGRGTAASRPDPVETLVRLHRLGTGLRALAAAAPVQAHILNMVMASVGKFDQLVGLSGRRIAALRDFCQAEVDYPLGPRAAVALTLATTGWAAIQVARAEEPEQIVASTPEALAAVVVPTLRHRMKFEGAAFAPSTGDADADPQDRHDARVRDFARACCPDDMASAFDARLTAAAEAPQL
ncbi:AAA family ATPase [Mesobacterium pallidum]|uniref:AAA family ATPase n=1 Tax=Mesobacterium pallidum TaxID=2872037 RepID=UPI001EE2774C|nr:AAA family ATPase [Mesobacterium pallidum]